MQALKRAAAVFCIACICAELLAQMTDRGWARRCIKTVAGLYILVAFWNALPQLPENVHPASLSVHLLSYSASAALISCASSFTSRMRAVTASA